MKALKDLFLDTLADMHDAEKQMAKVLPTLSQAAASLELKEALDTHLEETEGHIRLVAEVFDCFSEMPRSKHCEASAGLLLEGEHLAKDYAGSSAVDAAIISAAQKVEHYEIATYGCLLTWAGLLGNEDAVDILAGILEEEKEADTKLNELALEQCNEEAMNDTPEDQRQKGKMGKFQARRSLTVKRANH